MNLTPNQKAQLIAKFPELRDWLEQRETNQLLTGLFSQIKLMKGDKGDTPVKGKDYFTDTEIAQIVEYIRNLVVTRDILRAATPVKGIHYKDGENGKDYILTGSDKKEIAGLISVPVVEKVIERTEVVKEILPKSIDVSSVKGAVSKKELEQESKKILDGMVRFEGRIKAVDQRWHGGGLSRVSHDSTLSGSGTPSDPLTVVGGTGTGYQKPLTGSLNQATFTWTTAPNVIVVDNIPRQKVQSDGTINWTGTTTTILNIWPTYDIYATA